MKPKDLGPAYLPKVRECTNFVTWNVKKIARDVGPRPAGGETVRTGAQIVLPQIRPALGALAIFTFLEYWNDYLNPLIYLSSTENMTLPLALSYFSTQHSTNLSATMAAAALIMIPAAIVFIIFQKQFIKGLALTGMK